MSDIPIPMQVVGGSHGMMDAGGGGVQPNNPLELVSKLTELQTHLNANKQFAAQFAAKKKFGQIVAGAKDMQAAVASAFQDPDVAAFAPELVQSAAQVSNDVLTGSGMLGTQARDAFHSYIQSQPAVIKDPSQAGTAKATALTLASPAIRDRLSRSIDLFEKGQNLGLDPGDNSPEAQEKRTQRLVGWAYANDAGDAVKNILGEQKLVDRGPDIQSGVVAPVQGGIHGEAPGQFTPGGPPIPKGIAPQLTDQNAMAAGGWGGSRGSAGNALAVPGGGASAPVQPKASAPAGAKPSAEAPPPGSGPTSFLGVPLYDSSTEMKAPPTVARNVSGGPAGIPGQQARDLADEFIKEGKHVYNNAVLTKAQLGEMSHDIDTMAKGGGLLSPGAGAEFRIGVGKFIDMLGKVTGTDFDIDTTKLATAEDLMKATQRMGITYLNTALGTQREAAETIKNITNKGVPGVNNTYLGSKMMIGMIGALNERAIEQYNWETKWSEKNNGDLRGAAQAFNTAFPADKYINKALENLGMDRKGFTSRAAVEKAYQDKLLTKEQANTILQNKGKIPNDLPKAE